MCSCVWSLPILWGGSLNLDSKNVLIVGVNASSLSCGDYCTWVCLLTSGFRDL